MPRRLRPFLILALLVLFGALIPVSLEIRAALAQDEDNDAVCTALVEAALTATNNLCSDTQRNQACYGHILLEATAVNPDNFDFADTGDKADLLNLQSMQLSGLDIAAETWGVAYMQVQANIPDTLPGQNVTFLLFGDVSIENEGGETIRQPATATQGVNVRLLPTANGTLLGSLGANEAVTATGRITNSAGEEWVRIDYGGSPAWVIAFALDVDLDALPVIEAQDPVFGPMQALYFSTGIGQPVCREAPDDGILIQTPTGVGAITFLINEVQVELGSTGYFRAVPGEGLFFSLLEGEGSMSFDGETQTLQPGTFSWVPLDDDGNPIGPPVPPAPYDGEQMGNLLGLANILPRPLNEIPEPTEPTTPTPVPVRTQPTQAADDTTDDNGGDDDDDDGDNGDDDGADQGGGDDTVTNPGACPRESSAAATLVVRNNNAPDSNILYAIYEVLEDCSEDFYGTVPPGTATGVPTFASYRFVIRDTAGNAQRSFTVPGGGQHEIVLP